MTKPDFLMCGEAARHFGLQSKFFSDLFYRGVLDTDKVQLVGNRRLIPRSYLDEIEQILIERGIIQEPAACSK